MTTIKRFLVLTIFLIVAAFPAAAQMTSSDGHYTATFLGVSYDVAAGTSTWRYQLDWDGVSPSLSHFGVGLCADSALVVSGVSPSSGFKVGDDPSTTRPGCFSESAPFYGIKWDGQPEARRYVYEFTLNGLYAVGPVEWVAKAGSDGPYPDTWCNRGTINGPSCDIADPKITIAKECLAHAFIGPVTYRVTVTNTGNVALTNVVVVDDDPNSTEDPNYTSDAFTLEPGDSREFDLPATVMTPGKKTNIATVSGEYWNWTGLTRTASCDTTFYALEVAKTATASFTRTNTWSIDKSVDPSLANPLEICGGQSASIPYQIDVTRTYADSDFVVSGTVTVHNPAPIPASVTLADSLSDGTQLQLSCVGATSAYATLTCDYFVELSSAASGTNTVTATLSNGTEFVARANYAFDSPTIVDPQAIVTDTVTCPEGFTCTSAGPWTFADSGSVSYLVDVANVGAVCDTQYDLANVATLSHDGMPISDGTSTSIYTCACSTGCTLTIGYWKTHAGFTGNNADRISQYLPVSLGPISVATREDAVAYLTMSIGDPSNGITKLRAQLLAAKLNVLNGASPADIAREIETADTFLARYDENAWNGLSRSVKKDILTLMTTLDLYNNGLIGPGHCN